MCVSFLCTLCAPQWVDARSSPHLLTCCGFCCVVVSSAVCCWVLLCCCDVCVQQRGAPAWYPWGDLVTIGGPSGDRPSHQWPHFWAASQQSSSPFACARLGGPTGVPHRASRPGAHALRLGSSGPAPLKWLWAWIGQARAGGGHVTPSGARRGRRSLFPHCVRPCPCAAFVSTP